MILSRYLERHVAGIAVHAGMLSICDSVSALPVNSRLAQPSSTTNESKDPSMRSF